MTVEIRPFADDDRAALLDLFGGAGEGAPSASLWGHEESEAAVYLSPYTVGYLAGCINSSRFPSESEDRAIKHYRLYLRTRPLAFFLRATFDLATAKIRRRPTAGDFEGPRWPSHLHINLVSHARGTGVAPAGVASSS